MYLRLVLTRVQAGVGGHVCRTFRNAAELAGSAGLVLLLRIDAELPVQRSTNCLLGSSLWLVSGFLVSGMVMSGLQTFRVDFCPWASPNKMVDRGDARLATVCPISKPQQWRPVVSGRFVQFPTAMVILGGNGSGTFPENRKRPFVDLHNGISTSDVTTLGFLLQF